MGLDMNPTSKPNRRARRTADVQGIDLANASPAEVAEIGQPLLRDYLLPDELAAELNVCEKTLDRWAAVGEGPPKTKIGRKTYYSRAGVAAWLRSREEKSKRAA
jgi:Helix-turn-helix domain